jgi:hypothetical protein
MVIVFSSNFAPDKLADGAFLRRLGYKILVDEINADQYRQIFCDVCADFGIAFDQASFDFLVTTLHGREQRPLLACYPRDLLAQVRDLARYRQQEPKLDPATLTWAWNNYFTTHAKHEAIAAAPSASGMFYERRNRANPGE